MGWGNIYLRRARVFAVALVVYFDYKALQQREKLTRKSKRSGLWERAHERNAKRVLNLIVELEGLWVKLGQYLSTRADVLPEAYVRLLRQLQDSLPPRPFREVSRTIEKELGKPIDEVFADIHKDALATASIAQVHRATLVNGQKVVVKVQHEGIKAVILEDLKNAKSIVDWIAWAEPQYDFNPMIDEWCKEAPKELDFNHEAENTRTVAKNLGCRTASDENVNPNRVDVLIPEVIQSTEKLLILEYMDGIRLSDLQSLAVRGVDNQKIVEEITRAYAHQIYIDGFFNGDPHPGNFLVSREVPHRPILLDFGLTKKLSPSFKQALAKMFLASVEGDQVALLSAFSEMGLKLRLDMPEQAMDIINVLFRATTSAKESIETAKQLNEQRNKNLKIIQEKMNMSEKDVKRFNPIDAFPGDIVIFTRVLNLLRGLSSSMNARIVYLDIMKPFAISALQGSIAMGPKFTDNWIFDTPVHSDVETKLRQLLVELGNKDKILGVQVCAYKDGKVIVDTAAGMLGKYDPRPVQPDSLFPVFSVTKGITAGMLHWLVDNGKLKLDENVANIWPEFKSNRKEHVKVHHILNHTSGLHNAMGNVIRENPAMLTDWNECLKCIAKAVPETEPGEKQLYHYLSFGWLCGGIIENASGKKFQDILEEAFVQPLQIEGELYIGIPPGVESRLAALTVDLDDLTKLSSMRARPNMPDDFQPRNMAGMVSTLPFMFNMLNTRRAIIPAANGHCSARALARFYAALVDSGTVPPPHSSSSKPALGSHPHVPKFPSLNLKPVKKLKSGKNKDPAPDPAVPDSLHCRDSSIDSSSRLVGGDSTSESASSTSTHQFVGGKLFGNPRIHDAFLGVGEYESFAIPEGEFGLGFKRYLSKDRSSFVGFGHSGIGGSTGFCNLESKFAIAVTLNKMSFGAVTARIIHFVCSELNIPVPEDYLRIMEIESDVGHTNSGGGPIVN